ncbi:MAG: 3-oxoacyl-[acyl-carrier-protein] reductase [Treponema sp.]|nr:3-oxoacyl-[acyl-carrier-protein] reductase [Treponema sp.]
MNFENKKVLVTGASRGIGRAVAEAFLAEGATVWGLSSKEPADLSKRLESANGKLSWLIADLSKIETVEGVIEQVLKSTDGFDVLVNNAGITKDGLAFRMKLEDFQRVLDVNLTAVFLVSRVIARDMARRRTGAIVNMTSVVGVHGNAGQVNYAASKAGLIGLTKSLAQEVAARGVRVNAVAPGFITSDMTNVMPEESRSKMLDHIPLKCAGTPDDVAKAVLFLAESSYITGQVLQVDGGMFM